MITLTNKQLLRIGFAYASFCNNELDQGTHTTLEYLKPSDDPSMLYVLHHMYEHLNRGDETNIDAANAWGKVYAGAVVHWLKFWHHIEFGNSQFAETYIAVRNKIKHYRPAPSFRDREHEMSYWLAYNEARTIDSLRNGTLTQYTVREKEGRHAWLSFGCGNKKERTETLLQAISWTKGYSLMPEFKDRVMICTREGLKKDGSLISKVVATYLNGVAI